MTIKMLKILFFFIFLLLCIIPAFAQVTNADFVLSKYFEAIGGKQNIDKLYSFSLCYKDSSIYDTFNGKFRERPQTAHSFMYVKGDSYRTEYKTHKPNVKDSSFIMMVANKNRVRFQSKTSAIDFPLYAFYNVVSVCRIGIDYPFYISKMENVKVYYKGVIQKENHQFYQIEITTPNNPRPLSYLFDLQNFLLIYTDFGDNTYTYYSDYRKVEGLLIPHSIETITKDSNIIYSKHELISIQFNADISDSLFD